MEKLLKDGRLFKLLEKVDWDIAQAAHEEVCRYCGGKLDCGNYTRKPRGGPRWDKRYSFDCSRCRKRKTPPSVRFLGRRVYVGVVVVLVSAMMHGLAPHRVERLRQELGIDEHTLKRWRAWWLETFVQNGFWKGARARFMPSLNEKAMPLSLVEAFGTNREGLRKLLEFLSPITVPGKGVAAM
ncbi:hypothetical protein ACFLQU_03210 [Verrucomicrobiota bacterium]